MLLAAIGLAVLSLLVVLYHLTADQLLTALGAEDADIIRGALQTDDGTWEALKLKLRGILGSQA